MMPSLAKSETHAVRRPLQSQMAAWRTDLTQREGETHSWVGYESDGDTTYTQGS